MREEEFIFRFIYSPCRRMAVKSPVSSRHGRSMMLTTLAIKCSRLHGLLISPRADVCRARDYVPGSLVAASFEDRSFIWRRPLCAAGGFKRRCRFFGLLGFAVTIAADASIETSPSHTMRTLSYRQPSCSHIDNIAPPRLTESKSRSLIIV